MVKMVQDESEKSRITESVLNTILEWFGIEVYRNEYIKGVKHCPFFAAYLKDEPIGFIALKKTSGVTGEIYCMGVMKEHHHKGYGKRLYKAIEEYARSEGLKLLQVKTVEKGTYDSYDQTNLFYESLGFMPLEVFKTLWDEHNPCLIYVKPL